MDFEATFSGLIEYLTTEATVLQVFLIVFFSLLIDFVQKRIIVRLYGRLETTENIWDDALVKAAMGPASWREAMTMTSAPRTVGMWRMGPPFARLISSSLIGESEALRDVLSTAERAASSDVSVVIAGESGTGKELLARAIHFNGPRAASE